MADVSGRRFAESAFSPDADSWSLPLCLKARIHADIGDVYPIDPRPRLSEDQIDGRQS
jgi:hypothetical protein